MISRRAWTTVAAVCAAAAVPAGSAGAQAVHERTTEAFPGVMAPVDRNGALGSDARVVRYESARQAIVRTAGGRQRLVVSTAPLRTADGRPVDLAMQQVAGGFSRPVAAPYFLAVAPNADQGFSIGRNGAVAVSVMPLAADDAAITDQGDVLAAADTQQAVDTVLRPTASGLSTFEVLKSPAAPSTFRYRLGLTEGQTAKIVGGTVVVASGGRTDLVVTAPFAVDAGGRAVPVSLALDGNVISMSVGDDRADYSYPVLVDPEWETSYDWQAATTGNEGWFVDPTSDLSYYNIGIFSGVDPGIRITPKTGQLFPENVLGGMLWQAPGTTHVSSATFTNVFRQNDTARQVARLQLSYPGVAINDDHNTPGPADTADVTITDPDSLAQFVAVKLFTPPCAPSEVSCPRTISAGNLSAIKVGTVAITIVDDTAPTTSASGTLKDLGDQWTQGNQSATVDLTATDDGLGVKSWSFTVTDSAGEHGITGATPACDNLHQTSGQGSNICPFSDSRTGVSVDLAQLPEQGANRFKLSATDLVDQSSEDAGTSTAWTTYIDRTTPTLTASGDLFSSSPTWIRPEQLGTVCGLGLQMRCRVLRARGCGLPMGGGGELADEVTNACSPVGPVAQPCPNTYAHDLTFDPDTFPEGSLSFEATATDHVGLSSAASSWRLLVDRTPPIGRASGDLVALKEQWTGQTGDVSVSLDGRDRLSGVERLLLQVKNADGYRTLGEVATCDQPGDKDPADGSCPHLVSRPVSVDAGDLPDGKNEFVIAAYDQAGHRSRDTDSWDTYIDHTPPPAPTGLKVVSNTADLAVVSWNPVQDLPEGAPAVTYEYAVVTPGQQFVTWTSTPYPTALVSVPSEGALAVVKVCPVDKSRNRGKCSEEPVAKAALTTEEEVARRVWKDMYFPEEWLDEAGSKVMQGAEDGLRRSLRTVARRSLKWFRVVGTVIDVLVFPDETSCEQGLFVAGVKRVNVDVRAVLRAVYGASVGRHPGLRDQVGQMRSRYAQMRQQAGEDAKSADSSCRATPEAARVGAGVMFDDVLPAARSHLLALERQGQRRQAWADTKEARSLKPVQPRRCEDAKYLWERLVPGPGRRNYVVYWAAPPLPDENVKYIGRSRNLPRRCKRHPVERRRSLQSLRLPPLTLYEAMQVEEALIAHFGLKGDVHNVTGGSGRLTNLRHEISRARPDYCWHLVRGQYVLQAAGYGRYAAAFFTAGRECPGVGGRGDGKA